MAKHPRPSNETKEIRVYECVYEYGKAPPITYSYTYSYTRISSFLQRLDWTDPLFAGTYVAKRISLGPLSHSAIGCCDVTSSGA